MSGLLETYISRRNICITELSGRTDSGIPEKYLELTYRISVLESVRGLCRAASAADDGNGKEDIYMLFANYISGLLREIIPCSPDPAVQKRRTTAFETAADVVKDIDRQFRHRKYADGGGFYKFFRSAADSFLAVWIAYRNTIIEL